LRDKFTAASRGQAACFHGPDERRDPDQQAVRRRASSIARELLENCARQGRDGEACRRHDDAGEEQRDVGIEPQRDRRRAAAEQGDDADRKTGVVGIGHGLVLRRIRLAERADDPRQARQLAVGQALDRRNDRTALALRRPLDQVRRRALERHRERLEDRLRVGLFPVSIRDSVDLENVVTVSRTSSTTASCDSSRCRRQARIKFGLFPARMLRFRALILVGTTRFYGTRRTRSLP
jgi:hypothetical protein